MSKQPAKEGEKRALPGSYSEMYPNRFLKADMLKGHKVTLTIKAIEGEGLMSDDGGANLEWVASFAERPLQLVVNKTNAFCMYRMFGGDPHSWINRKITLFPTTVMAFGAKQDCIRIWGSPELEEDLPITVPNGRKKKLEMVMHKTASEPKPVAQAPVILPAVNPRISVAFGILGYNLVQQAEYLTENAAFTQAQMLADLNRIIDEANAA